MTIIKKIAATFILSLVFNTFPASASNKMNDAEILTNCSTVMGLFGTTIIIGETPYSVEDALVLMGEWQISAINATRDLNKISNDEAKSIYDEKLMSNHKAWEYFASNDKDAYTKRIFDALKECSNLEYIKNKYY